MKSMLFSRTRFVWLKLTNRRAWLAGVLAAGLAMAGLTAVIAEVPAGWKSYRGNFFKIGVPPGFVATPQGKAGGGGKYDELLLWNEKLQVAFQVFSPQWNGEATFKEVADRAEVLTSRESKKVGKVQEEQLTITARDKSYIRYVVSRTKVDENTNTTFGVRIPNMKVYEQIKPTYVKWKASLEQYAD